MVCRVKTKPKRMLPDSLTFKMSSTQLASPDIEACKVNRNKKNFFIEKMQTASLHTNSNNSFY